MMQVTSVNNNKDSSNLNYSFSTVLRGDFENIPKGVPQELYGNYSQPTAYKIKSVNVKCDVYTTDLSVEVRLANILVTTIRIKGNYSAAEICNKLKTELLAVATSCINMDITYNTNTGLFTMISGNTGPGDYSVTFADNKTMYYFGGHIYRNNVWTIAASSGGSVNYTWTSSAPASISVFPPAIYLRSSGLSSAENYAVGTVGVLYDERLVDSNYKWKWITIDNENASLNFFHGSTYFNSQQFDIMVENVNTGTLEPLLVDFQVNYELV